MIEAAKVGSPFEAVLEHQKDAACISVSGDFGPGWLAKLKEPLEEVQRQHVRFLILDLRGLGAIQTDEIAELLQTWSRERRNGSALILVRVPKRLRLAVEQTGLDRALPIAYDGGRFEQNP